MAKAIFFFFPPPKPDSQSAIDAALDLREELDSIEEIEWIKIETFDAAVDIIGGEEEKWRPKSRETADHSLPYCVAVALADRKVGMEQFAESRFTDPALLELVARISVHRSSDLNKLYPEGI